jgi:hypothetical protein
VDVGELKDRRGQLLAIAHDRWMNESRPRAAKAIG